MHMIVDETNQAQHELSFQMTLIPFIPLTVSIYKLLKLIFKATMYASRVALHGPSALGGQRRISAFSPPHVVFSHSIPRRTSIQPCHASSNELDSLVSRALTEKHHTMKSVKKYLSSISWEPAWIDGVTAEIMKKRLDTNADRCKEVIEYLTNTVGIPNHRVENMVAINKQILGQRVENLQATVEFLQSKGITGDALVVFLETHPVILRYIPESGQSYLVLNRGEAVDTKSRAKLVLEGQEPSVVYYRDVAIFGTAPISIKID